MSGPHVPGDDPAAPLPADLRFLKRLTGTLAGVMILGLITIVALLVIRLGPGAQLSPVRPPDIALPPEIVLPEGATARAVMRDAAGWVVLTADGQVLAFSPEGRATGAARLR